jgi:hypothetical protein
MAICSDKLWFIISLGITLLLSGLIMFYVKQRFSVYDRHITEQNQLLKHLVNSIRTNTSPLSAKGAVDEARKYHEQLNLHNDTNTNSLIVVSDDEQDDESDEDSSSSEESTADDSKESDTESDDDSDDLDIHDDKLNIKQINLSNDGIGLGLKLDNLSGMFKYLDKTDTKSDDDCVDDSDSDESDTESQSELDNEINRCVLQCVNIEDTLNNNDNDDNNDSRLQISTNMTNSPKSPSPLSYDIKSISVNLNDNDEKIVDASENGDLENMLIKQKYIDMSKHNLQELCKERHISSKGSKKELIDRLLE